MPSDERSDLGLLRPCAARGGGGQVRSKRADFHDTIDRALVAHAHSSSTCAAPRATTPPPPPPPPLSACTESDVTEPAPAAVVAAATLTAEQMNAPTAVGSAAIVWVTDGEAGRPARPQRSVSQFFGAPAG